MQTWCLYNHFNLRLINQFDPTIRSAEQFLVHKTCFSHSWSIISTKSWQKCLNLHFPRYWLIVSTIQLLGLETSISNLQEFRAFYLYWLNYVHPTRLEYWYLANVAIFSPINYNSHLVINHPLKNIHSKWLLQFINLFWFKFSQKN